MLVLLAVMIVMIFVDVMPISGLICCSAIAMVRRDYSNSQCDHD